MHLKKPETTTGPADFTVFATSVFKNHYSFFPDLFVTIILCVDHMIAFVVFLFLTAYCTCRGMNASCNFSVFSFACFLILSSPISLFLCHITILFCDSPLRLFFHDVQYVPPVLLFIFSRRYRENILIEIFRFYCMSNFKKSCIFRNADHVKDILRLDLSSDSFC